MYIFRVLAVNTAGDGAYAESGSTTVPAGVAKLVSLSALPGTVLVALAAPNRTGMLGGG